MVHIEGNSHITRSLNKDNSWLLIKTMNQQDSNINATAASTGGLWCPVRAAKDMENKHTTQLNPPSERKGSSAYIQYMQQIYSMTAATRQPNYIAARCQLPANIRFAESETLIRSPEDVVTVDCLKCGFMVGYQGPLPTPTEGNRGSTRLHLGDTVAYITREVSGGTMLRPFNSPPFTP